VLPRGWTHATVPIRDRGLLPAAQETGRNASPSDGEGAQQKPPESVHESAGLPNGLGLSCGLPAPQRRKMASTGHSDRRGASGPTASSAC
jgi:hypothetical protein